MNRIVAQVGDGATLSHDGRVALAALFADRIPALAAALRTGAPVDLDAKAEPGEEERVQAEVQDVADCLNQIVADPDARLVLLAGLDEGIVTWAQGLATQVGDHFATHPGQSPVTAVPEVASRDDFQASGKDLGELLSQVAVALREQVKDAKERAAQMAGMLTFVVSQGVDALAKKSGVGVVAAFGADRVKALAEDHIKALTEWFANVEGKQALEDQFLKRVEKGLQDVMAAALWADPRVRERLFATPGFTPPNPEFLDADGNLRPPPPETEAYGRYRNWLQKPVDKKGEGLLGQADKCLENSGLNDQVYRGMVTKLFSE